MRTVTTLTTPVEITVNNDWHDTQTLQLGELMEAGFDPFGDEDWPQAGWYDEDTRKRIEHKFEKHYRYWEISITPPGKWRDMLTARALLTVPKYADLYKLKAQGVNLLAIRDEWLKNRSLFSDFPGTRLSPATEDYAANGTDFQQETIDTGNLLDQIERLKTYRDVDAMLLDEFHILFSQLAEPTVEW